MEYINRIHLRGVVGSTRKMERGGRTACQFTLATNRTYRDTEGYAVIETTWHNVVFWESGNLPSADEITKGAGVEVIGHIRSTIRTMSDGNEVPVFEITASKVIIHKNPLTMESEETKDKVYVLTETENCNPPHAHSEVFIDKESACETLRNRYRDTVVLGNHDTIKEAHISVSSEDAWYRTEDGLAVAWKVKECEFL